MVAVLRTTNRGFIKARTVPSGLVRINWSHPITRGLVYLRLFNQYQASPVYTSLATETSGSIYSPKALVGSGSIGPGFVGSDNTAYFGTGNAGTNKCVMPQSAGTVVALVQANFSPTDGISHYVFQCGNPAYSGGPNIDITKFSNNNLYAGWWFAGNDSRAIVGATGLWSAGDIFTVGCSYTSGGNTSSYVKGVLAVANFNPCATGDTSGASTDFNIGNGTSEGVPTGGWWQANGDAIYYVAIWNRVLTASEHLDIYRDSFCLFAPQFDMPALNSVAAATTIFPFWKTQAMMDGVFRGNHPIDYGV